MSKAIPPGGTVAEACWIVNILFYDARSSGRLNINLDKVRLQNYLFRRYHPSANVQPWVEAAMKTVRDHWPRCQELVRSSDVNLRRLARFIIYLRHDLRVSTFEEFCGAAHEHDCCRSTDPVWLFLP